MRDTAVIHHIGDLRKRMMVFPDHLLDPVDLFQDHILTQRNGHLLLELIGQMMV